MKLAIFGEAGTGKTHCNKIIIKIAKLILKQNMI